MATEPAESENEGTTHADEAPEQAPTDCGTNADESGDTAQGEPAQLALPVAEQPAADALPESPPVAQLPASPDAEGVAQQAHEAAEPVAAGFAATRGPVPWWPFVVYGVAWLVLAAITARQLARVPDGTAPYDAAIYGTLIYGGIALTAVGVLLPFVVWAVARSRASDRLEPIFVPALLRGAVATFIGVAVWWTALGYVDYVRLGGML